VAHDGKGVFRRWLERLSESDELRLARELSSWAAKVSGSVRIAEARPRQHAKLAGVVRRISIRPVKGFDALQVVLYDGTGDAAAVWLGRRSIPGLTLGSRLVVEGMLGEEQGMKRIVNPTFEFVGSEES
jgi:hypothetical protein